MIKPPSDEAIISRMNFIEQDVNDKLADPSGLSAAEKPPQRR